MSEYRVYIGQINQSVIDVDADSKQDAIDKARRKWRKEDAIPVVNYVDKKFDNEPIENV